METNDKNNHNQNLKFSQKINKLQVNLTSQIYFKK